MTSPIHPGKRGVRERVVTVAVVALWLGAAGGTGEPQLLHAPVPRELAVDTVAVVPQLSVELVLPATVTRGPAIEGELRIENVGRIDCVVPADLRSCDGALRLEWTAPDGNTHSHCLLPEHWLAQRCAGTDARTRTPVQHSGPGDAVLLVPGGFYGHRVSLERKERCIADCDWMPGRYVFRATIHVCGAEHGGRSPGIAVRCGSHQTLRSPDVVVDVTSAD